MIPELKALAIQAFPYPDPWAREHMRRRARGLIAASPWPEDAASSIDIAQLALLRLLHLQREAHKCARFGGFEGTMLLARASVDTCISGLYWLDQPDAGAQLTNASAKSAKQMLKGIMATLQVPTAALDDAARLIGEPVNLPRMRQMAEHVASRSGVPVTEVLYEQIYMPLSFLFEHTTGLALQRHIDRDGHLIDRPEQWWTRRRALHTVDLCTGYLAAVLARHASRDTQVFNTYVESHAKRMLAPAVTMFLRLARRTVRVADLPKLVREAISLRGASDTYNSFATPDERAAFARDRVRQATDAFHFFDDEELRDALIDILIDNLVRTDGIQTEPRRGPA